LLALCLGISTIVVANAATAHADGEPTDAPRLRVGSATVVEATAGKQAVALELSLTRPLDHDLAVTLTTRDISATAPADYKAITKPKRVVVRAGKTSRQVSVTVFGDGQAEGDEQFALDVVSTDDPAVEPGTSGVVTIVDASTSATPVVQLGAATVQEGPSGKTVAKVPLTLSRPLDHDIWVDVSTTSDTATGGVDFRPVDRSIRIRAGRVAAKVSVTVFGDLEVEGDEVLRLHVDAISDGAVAVGPDLYGTVTIRNDDRPAAPGPVQNLAAVLVPGELGLVRISWDAPDTGGPTDGYLVDWLDGAGMWQTIFVDSPTSTKHECGVPAVTCSYRVTPTGAGGYGPATSVSVVTQTTPGVPTGLTWSTIMGTRSVFLDWSPPASNGGAPILRYEVRRTSDLDSSFRPLPNATWTTMTTTASQLTTNCNLTPTGTNRCYFQVRAENALGPSPWSTGVLAQTFVSPPTPPKGEPGPARPGT
jgi:hypothetical protein